MAYSKPFLLLSLFFLISSVTARQLLNANKAQQTSELAEQKLPVQLNTDQADRVKTDGDHSSYGDPGSYSPNPYPGIGGYPGGPGHGGYDHNGGGPGGGDRGGGHGGDRGGHGGHGHGGHKHGEYGGRYPPVVEAKSGGN